ncbi:MAG: hypothetical protein JSS66_13085 [Armatimonadetes bacterium]|nr:hypothetical protein [Armatimonadota bacterium]
MPDLEGYNELRNSAAKIYWPGLEAFTLRGADAAEWLQGQVTNDVRLVAKMPWLDACVVKPTGQIEGVVRIWARNEELLLVTDAGSVLRDRVERFVILEDVVLEELGPIACTVQGPLAEKAVVGCEAVPSPRLGGEGFDVLSGEPDMPAAGWSTVLVRSLEEGVPLPNVDIDARAFPAEFPPPFDSEHVSYEKGCYTGQEVLMRLHSRGHTNRAWRVLEGLEVVEPGAPVTVGEETVGHVVRTAESPTMGFLLSAYLKVDAAGTGTQLQCAGKAVRVKV